MAEQGARERPASLLHRGLGRAEFFDFAPAELEQLDRALAGLAREGRSRFSFHAPVSRPRYFPFSGVTCFYLNGDAGKRELSFRLLGHTLAEARRWGADYVVTHLTHGPTDTPDGVSAARLAGEACRRMAAMSRDFAIPVDVEFAAYSRAFHGPERFADAVGAYPELGICIDAGHAFLGAEARGTDYLEDIRTLAPLARSLHLWNTKGIEHNRRHGHVSLNPAQRPADGWIDLEQVMAIVLAASDEVSVIFEYPVARVTPEIQEGYDWIAGVVAGHSETMATAAGAAVSGRPWPAR